MVDFANELIHVNIEDEMRSAYLDYSMSVIVGRALPDIRDGLKPVHRRILYAMFREGMHFNRRYSKCAGVVGEVLKKYHPHGDSAVYDALVRMAQPWNMRHPLVDGQGNFGSIDGDSAAAYRYTECRMMRLASELMADIDKDTVAFSPNFDGSTEEPEVLPARYPNLLVNGSDGIAVGMATKIPPHNLGEIINACVALIDNPELSLDELLEIVPGPDFPTGASICGTKGVYDAYSTGRGRIIMRGVAHFEEIRERRNALVIDEIPFQVNKARLVEEIANKIRDKVIEGVAALRDESDRSGMRIVLELKRDAVGEVVLNKLYKHTPLQSTFGTILLTIVEGRPQILPLVELLRHYLDHRRVVVSRRTEYDLRKARARAHVLEGYRIALDNLDEVIALIRASRTPEEARSGLMRSFGLTEIQAQAILDLRLQRLTGMEREKIDEEYAQIQIEIAEYERLLADPALIMAVVRDELVEVRDRYQNERRTQFVMDPGEFSIEDLIPEEEQVVTLTHRGYIKRTSADEYAVQRRGGMGKKAMRTLDEDFVRDIFVANTHGSILVFTTKGRMFRLRVYEVPEAGRDARGRPIINLVQFQDDEKVAAVLSVKGMDQDVDLLFCSRRGLVKRTELSKYLNVRRTGILACAIADEDEILTVKLCDRDQDVLLVTHHGMSIRFHGDQIRPMGRVSRGNKGVSLKNDDFLVDMVVVDRAPDDESEIVEVDEENPETLLTVLTGGVGKRTSVTEYRPQKRGGMGLIDIKTGGTHVDGEARGEVVGAIVVRQGDRVMLVTDTGRAIQIQVDGISIIGRNTKGVRLMRVADDERIVSVARMVEADDDELLEEALGEESAGEGVSEDTPAEASPSEE